MVLFGIASCFSIISVYPCSYYLCDTRKHLWKYLTQTPQAHICILFNTLTLIVEHHRIVLDKYLVKLLVTQQHPDAKHLQIVVFN